MIDGYAYEYLRKFIVEATFLTLEERKNLKKLSPPPRKKMKGKIMKVFDEDLNLNIPNFTAPIIDAIKKGHYMAAEIEKITGIKQGAINSTFCYLTDYLTKHKLINPNNGKTKRQTVVDFIQSRLLDNDYVEKPSPVIPLTEVKELEQAPVTPEKPEPVKPVRVVAKAEEIQPRNNPTISELKVLLDAKIKKLQEQRKLIEDLEKELISI